MFALPKAALPLFRSVAGACVLPMAKRFLTAGRVRRACDDAPLSVPVLFTTSLAAGSL